MRVTFFGHRQVLEEIEDVLTETIEELIVHQNADVFYVGHQGDFDSSVRQTLKRLQKIYPRISYTVVLAYMPSIGKPLFEEDVPTLYPDALEKVPYRFAISYRNQWMIEHSDVVVSYVTHSIGGAAMFTEKAKKKGKRIVRLNVK